MGTKVSGAHCCCCCRPCCYWWSCCCSHSGGGIILSTLLLFSIQKNGITPIDVGWNPPLPPPPLPFKWPHFSPLPPLPSLLYDVILFNWRNLYGTHPLTFNFFFCYLRSNLISIWKKRYESILMVFFLCGFNVTRVQFTAAFISVSGRKRSLWMLEDAGEVCGMLGGVWDAGRWGWFLATVMVV